MRIFKSLLVFYCLCLIGNSLTANAQVYPYRVSDSLFAGDTTIVRFHLGQYNPDHLTAVLNPHNVYFPENCPMCHPDSIWSYKIELYMDTIFDFYFAVPLGTLPGSYDMVILYNGYPTGKQPYQNWLFTPPYIFENAKDIVICEGDTSTFYIRALGNSNYDLWYHWYHDDKFLYSTQDGLFGTSFTQTQDTGNYYCIITNYYGEEGTDTSEIFHLGLFPTPANPGPPAGPDKFCPGTDTTSYTIIYDPLAIEYAWHLVPKEAGIIEFQDTFARVIWDNDYSGLAEIYLDLQGDNCSKITSDILEITVPGISVSPEICIVGIDEETGKYNIVWEKSQIHSEKSYKIYRESNQADVYLEIGSVNEDKPGVLIDSSSAPDILSHRYKVSYIDSCGNESLLSPFHQTMHLSANMSIYNDVNLIWSEYKGISFPTYEIYRGDQPDNLQLLTQVPSTVTAFKDTDIPLWGIIWYQIGMYNPEGCNPQKKSGTDFSYSRSNIEPVQNTALKEIMMEHNPFILYPDPAENELYFRCSKTFSNPIHYKIYDMRGLNVLEGLIPQVRNNIDISSLPAGLFLIELRIENEVFRLRFAHFL